MTSDIWVRAWLQKAGLSGGATPGAGAQSAVVHQGDAVQKLNAANRERDTRDLGTGGQGGGASDQNAGKYVWDQNLGGLGSTRGTGGTPSRTGSSKNQIPV